MKHMTGLIILVLFLAVASQPAVAQWPSDAGLNLAIANHATGEQVVPKIAVTPDGGCYVGWYDNSYTGNYDVYLQKLDAQGVEQWAHNGICVSSHAQNSWLTEWDLISDSQGNAVLAFNDIRAGVDWNVFVYKISPAGERLWGADGLAVSGTDTDDEVTPTLTEASDGDVVVAWAKMAGARVILMQRIAPDGTLRFPSAVAAITGAGTERPAFPDLVPSLAGSVILSYVRDISQYMSPRHFMAQRISTAGSPVWATPAAIMNDYSLPMGYYPTIKTDGAGGLVTAYHRAEGNHIVSRAQHVTAAGAELFAHNGVSLSTNPTQHQIDPTYSYDAANSVIYVFWNQRNPEQTAWGIFGQKVPSNGTRAWGDLGLGLLPVDNINDSYPRMVQLNQDVVLFVADEPNGQAGMARLRAWRINPAGQAVWSAPATVSSHLSSKNRLPAAINGSGMSVIVWEDDRTGTPDVYGQNVNPDGTLGASSVAVGETGRPAMFSLTCTPNPSASSARLDLALASPVAQAALAITDVGGRLVRRIPLGDLTAGSHAIAWNGRNDAGEPAASGIYYARLEGASGEAVRMVRMR